MPISSTHRHMSERQERSADELAVDKVDKVGAVKAVRSDQAGRVGIAGEEGEIVKGDDMSGGGEGVEKANDHAMFKCLPDMALSQVLCMLWEGTYIEGEVHLSRERRTKYIHNTHSNISESFNQLAH